MASSPASSASATWSSTGSTTWNSRPTSCATPISRRTDASSRGGWTSLLRLDSRRDFSAQLVLAMGTDDVLERGLDAEAERQRPARVEAARPAVDDAHDELVGLTPDARRHLVAGDAAQRRDLLADGAAHARHGEVHARPDLLAREPGGMDEEADG